MVHRNVLHCNIDAVQGIGLVGAKGVFNAFPMNASYSDRQPYAKRTMPAAGEAPKVTVVFHTLPSHAEWLTRSFDVLIASMALMFFAPLMLVIALIIAATSSGPILYRQRRIGRGGVTFTCLKFRTMRVDADHILEHLLANDPVLRADWDRDRKMQFDPRIIRFGGLLRKLSLDELPQFFNVLDGTMSIVGPRPIVEAESVRYGRYFSAYCQVRPGITGLWQISGRNSTTYRRRVACDVSYVRRRSPLVYGQIIIKTIPAVCLGRGAY